MRILLVTPYFPPQNATASTRTHGFARCWAAAGHDVTVLTTAKRDDQRGLDAPGDGFQVVEIDYAPPRFLERLRQSHQNGSDQNSGEQSSPGALRRLRERTGIFGSVRMPDLTDFWVAPALAWARAHAEAETGGRGWDVVVSSSGPYTAHLVARAIRQDELAHFWAADFRDLWTHNHLFGGLFPFTIAERLLERRCLHQADLITTVSEPLAQWLTKRTKAPVAVIYNGFDASALRDQRIEPTDRGQNRVQLVYTGSIYPRGQDPSPLLRAMAQLQRSDPLAAERLKLIIAGSGESHWRSLADQFGVASMLEFKGRLGRKDALNLQRRASALIVLDWNDPIAGVLTGKVFDYLPLRAPIVAIGGERASALGDLLQRTGRGVHCEGDGSAVLSAIGGLLSNSLQLPTLRDDDLISSFSLENQAKRFLEMIHRGAPAAA